MTLPPGLIELINSCGNEFDMYFKNPDEIVQIFHNLELNSLFLIRTNQDIEINNEEINTDYKNVMKKYDAEIESLKKHRRNLNDKIADEKNKKKALDRVRSDKEIEAVFGELDQEIKKACEQLEMPKDMTSIDMLKDLEKKIEGQLAILTKIDPIIVNKYERMIIDETKKEKKADVNHKQAMMDEEKKKKILEKTGKRRVGRPIMFRSKLNKEEKQEVKDDEIDEEEEDNIRYFT